MGDHASAIHRDDHTRFATDHDRLERPERARDASALSFVDNRPDAAKAAQLRRNAAIGPHVRQLQAFQAMADDFAPHQAAPADRAPNRTGLPDALKSGVESLSGISMDDVKVHYQSDMPAQLQAHAYAQGNDIHLAPGQERHLPHEAWHVVQQKQGRVSATRQLKGAGALNEDPGLEAEADAMGAAASRGPTSSNGEGTRKHVATAGVRNFPGVVQRLKVTTPPEFTDIGTGTTYLFDDILSIDLTGIIAAGVEPDDPNIETFEWMLRGARAESVLAGKAQEVKDIDEVLHHLANPDASTFAEAAGSHRLGGSAADFGTIKGTVEGWFTTRDDYRVAIGQKRVLYSTRAKLSTYKKLKEYVTPFTSIPDMALNGHSALRDEVLTLFSWLIPLHDEVIKGLPNKESLMYRIKICLVEKTNALKNSISGTAIGPSGSLIRYGAMQTIRGEQLGTRSEIKTGLSGALSSGEPATPRQIETELTQHFRYPGNGFVAGHLVADTLGGKNVRDNLTPITNQFNTSGGARGIKAPEIEGLKRLKAGKVIFYSTTVQYGNAGNGTKAVAVRPTRLQIRVADLGLTEDGVSTDIADYKDVSNESIYDLDPT